MEARVVLRANAPHKLGVAAIQVLASAAQVLIAVEIRSSAVLECREERRRFELVAMSIGFSREE